MALVEAGLAFAVTMLAVATLVTLLIDLVLRAAGIRKKQMKRFLTEFIREKLTPLINQEAQRVGTELKGMQVENTRLAGKNLAEEPTFKALLREIDTDGLVELSTKELKERLLDSEFGKAIIALGSETAKELLDRLGQAYEEFGDQFSRSFRSNARRWSMVAAFLLAVVVNIDSVHLLGAYVKNTETAAVVLAQRESWLQTAAREAPENPDFQEQLGDVRVRIDELLTGGMPVGWSYFPHCGDSAADKRCRASSGSESVVGRLKSYSGLLWLLGCVLTGLLAGLGAPFWRDIVTGVNQLVTMTRGSRRRTVEAASRAG